MLWQSCGCTHTLYMCLPSSTYQDTLPVTSTGNSSPDTSMSAYISGQTQINAVTLLPGNGVD